MCNISKILMSKNKVSKIMELPEDLLCSDMVYILFAVVIFTDVEFSVYLYTNIVSSNRESFRI